MKRVIYLFVFLIISSIAYMGCNKNETEPEVYTVEISEDDMQLEKQILQFKNDMNSNLKSGSKVNIDDMVWFVEAVLNYSYVFTSVNYENYLEDETVIEIEYNEDYMTSFGNVKQFYDECYEFICTKFHEKEFENKHVGALDIEIIEDQCDNGKVSIKVTMLTGIVELKKAGGGGSVDPFGSTDYWYFYTGKCNGYTGGNDSYAGNEIAKEARRRINGYPSIYYFTDVDRVYTNGPITSSWPNELFDCVPIYVNIDKCFEPNEMYHYYQGLLNVVEYYKPYGKKLKTCSLIRQIPVGKGDGSCYYEPKLYYGVRHKQTSEPINPGI